MPRQGLVAAGSPVEPTPREGCQAFGRRCSSVAHADVSQPLSGFRAACARLFWRLGSANVPGCAHASGAGSGHLHGRWFWCGGDLGCQQWPVCARCRAWASVASSSAAAAVSLSAVRTWHVLLDLQRHQLRDGWQVRGR